MENTKQIEKMSEQKEDINLAFHICIQSFLPLICILLVLHFDFVFSKSDNLRFWKDKFNFDIFSFLRNNYLLIFVYLCYLIFLFLGLRTNKILSKIIKNQEKGGYSIEEISKHEKQSLNYFLTYLLPLVGNTPSHIKEFLVFFFLLYIIILCVFKENLFFDNIILIHLFNYSVFDFTCKETNEKCIGITRNNIPTESQNIRFQRICKNVYYVEVITK